MAIHRIAGPGKSGKGKLTRNASTLAKAEAGTRRSGIGKTVSAISKKRGAVKSSKRRKP